MELTQVLAECRRRDRLRILLGIAIAALLLVSLAASGGLELRRYADAGRTIIQLLADATPPDFARGAAWLKPLFETLMMSVGATLISGLAAFPLSLLAARTTRFPKPVAGAAQLLLNIARSIPELVFGIIFVAAVGFGPLAGLLALACHSVGMLGKFATEHLEHLDQAPAAALESQGVSRAGIIRFCLVPQVLPRLVDLTLYRWEHNVRAASVMGMVGAGGLGLELITAFSLFEYREAVAILFVILATVSIIDLASRRLRMLLVERS
ncbi:phosphonate ABC transporter, permease protein PhnE [Bradyrhizobium diazoefficiens]|nr:phosphonate ABC transporter, permease protein PhnE [Bradyrhizobium diazoefficiens]MBR0848861.1 phosphonate ABC transporter, permease protein PhnE [Bradyrhizobium diazoefficiens]